MDECCLYATSVDWRCAQQPKSGRPPLHSTQHRTSLLIPSSGDPHHITQHSRPYRYPSTQPQHHHHHHSPTSNPPTHTSERTVVSPIANLIKSPQDVASPRPQLLPLPLDQSALRYNTSQPYVIVVEY
ncbi:hypothetical protein E2C01_043812 [Portunus trituberculatus]|uniref:Uncharacterized protein n=1 Tax=Portunus trituberculatus TaxID=210409 RepID=A0A5B7FXD4_PORTR|nr:hypothetical protein [Portunus trituberculatus]